MTTKEMRRQVGRNVREVREAIGIGQLELSRRVQRMGGTVSLAVIIRLETGEDGHMPAFDRIIWIARALGCPMERLIRGIPIDMTSDRDNPLPEPVTH